MKAAHATPNKRLFPILAVFALALVAFFSLTLATSAQSVPSKSQSNDKPVSKGPLATATPALDSKGKPLTDPNGGPTPTAVGTICVLFDTGFESGTLHPYDSVVATCVPGNCGWFVTALSPYTGQYSAFAPEGNNISDQLLVRDHGIGVYYQGEFAFWHSYDFENGGGTYYDGGVLEGSTNGGATWFDLGPNITYNGYNGTISSCCSNPLAGHLAWVGSSGGYINSRVNITPFAGQVLSIRFRLVTDSSIAGNGWHIDQIYYVTFCGNSTYTPVPSNTPTSTNTPTWTNTATPANTPTWTNTPTNTPTGQPTNTPIATATSVACSIEFADVPYGSTYYPFVHCLACRGIISGYQCGSPAEPCNGNNDPYFRPGGPVTRGQLAKIVSQSAGFTDPPSGQTFEDVPPASSIYTYVERLASRSVMGGYPCGGPNEPCGPNNLPYFRPAGGATRGQLTKIVSNAAGFTGNPPSTYTFTDVPVGSTFHIYVESLLANRPGVIGGYQCGGPAEPCDSESRPYFRPTNGLTRGQTSKINSNTFFPNCESRSAAK